ncbi:hypothetical protein CH063_14052, partial [Colletotrichum higginsianum]
PSEPQSDDAMSPKRPSHQESTCIHPPLPPPSVLPKSCEPPRRNAVRPFHKQTTCRAMRCPSSDLAPDSLPASCGK